MLNNTLPLYNCCYGFLPVQSGNVGSKLKKRTTRAILKQI